MTPEQKNKIRDGFFQRVKDSGMRSNILQLASLMSDMDDTEDTNLFSVGDEEDQPSSIWDNNTFWECLYHYSLKENWHDVPILLKEFKVEV